MSGAMREVKTVPRLGARKREAHKGEFGRVVVVAGATGYAGAGALAAVGALRSGAGLVSLFVPAGIYAVAAGASPSVMTHPAKSSPDFFRPEALEELKPLVEQADVLAVGPGLGRNEETGEFVRGLLDAGRFRQVKTVLDADGLWAVKRDLPVLKKRGALTVLTPHPGEMSYLTGAEIATIQGDRVGAARGLAERTGSVVVLKGSGTVVTDGARYYVNKTGNAGMATAGTGDVLTGIIAALLGQGMEGFEAAALGAYVHGLAGDLAAKELGQVSLISTDIIEYLPRAFVRQGRIRRS